ncbi:hypothetical protein [Carnobacterium maltaromaticum]|uniref:hypothetical protein n=1 Tax=Carnobacterium maltaromaticum TaxID=2751 RepID=UPI0010727ABE|nr:hypothetical protein [Carnobacterium maltaromaticum]TFJ76542.1 hypothetical protein CKN94_04020 [Carnobacterium maltaromaticum]TFJ79342.1 hypothetical protein CKN97_04015 [Carnobacterium maltaromaticum]
MEYADQIVFTVEDKEFEGYIEKVYENSFLVVALNSDTDLNEKYHGKLIIRKTDCRLLEGSR